MDIDRKELGKMFHIRKDLDSGRMIPIPMCAVDDEGKFHLWFIQGGEIIEAPWGEKGQTEFVEGQYFAQKRTLAHDFNLPFMNFMFQRYIRKDTNPILRAIRDDVFNLGTCLEKLELFHKLRNERIGIHRYVITEIEYIFVVCIRLFDLLQRIAMKLWTTIRKERKD